MSHTAFPLSMHWQGERRKRRKEERRGRKTNYLANLMRKLSVKPTVQDVPRHAHHILGRNCAGLAPSLDPQKLKS